MRRFLPVLAFLPMLSAHAGSSVPLTPAGNGHLVVPAFINGKGTVPFILDTGADKSSVYEWFAKQQALPAGKAVGMMGMTGATTTVTYRIGSITIDGRTIRNVEATGLPD